MSCGDHAGKYVVQNLQPEFSASSGRACINTKEIIVVSKSEVYTECAVCPQKSAWMQLCISGNSFNEPEALADDTAGNRLTCIAHKVGRIKSAAHAGTSQTWICRCESVSS